MLAREAKRGHEDWRARGQERGSAKVQIGAKLLCKGAKVGYESIEYGVLSIGRGRASEGARGHGDMGTWAHTRGPEAQRLGGPERQLTVQRCKCGGAACKGAKVGAAGGRVGELLARWHAAKQGRRRAAEGRGTIYRALLIRRARRSHAPTLVRPAANVKQRPAKDGHPYPMPWGLLRLESDGDGL
jgi:hypothetical protein